jgi:cytoskeletal protein RodZ
MKNHSLSFGRYLKSIRLEKGIDLDDVSRKTKIGMDYLLHIEKEEHDRLPAEVFVKGFLRAYAEVIGADGDEAVERYLSSCRMFQEAADFDADFIKASRTYWPRVLLSIGVMLVIIVLSVFMAPDTDKKSSGDNAAVPVSDGIGRDKFPRGSEAPAPQADKSETAAEKLSLKIVTVEDTWMKIAIDAQSEVEYSLKPGDLIELEASTGYDLFIGNAAGVHLTFNEKPVKIPGKSGLVVRLKLP